MTYTVPKLTKTELALLRNAVSSASLADADYVREVFEARSGIDLSDIDDMELRNQIRFVWADSVFAGNGEHPVFYSHVVGDKPGSRDRRLTDECEARKIFGRFVIVPGA